MPSDTIDALVALVQAGRAHLLAQHGDDHALDLARSFEGVLHEHARWLAASRELRTHLIDATDNLRSASERRQHECLWCCDLACNAEEASYAAQREDGQG